MEPNAFMFDEDCINKNAFHKIKIPISIDKVYIKRIVSPSKHWYGNKSSFKYYIGYMHVGNDFPILLCIKLLQMTGYVKYFDKNNKYIYFLVHDKDLLQIYSEI